MNSLLTIIKKHKKGAILIGAAIVIIASVGTVGCRAYMAKVQNDSADSVVKQMTNQVSRDFTSSSSNDKAVVKVTIAKLEADKAMVKAKEASMAYADGTNGSSSVLAKIDAQIKNENQKLSEIEAKEEADKKAAVAKKEAEEAAQKAAVAKKAAEAKKEAEEAAKKAAEAKAIKPSTSSKTNTYSNSSSSASKTSTSTKGSSSSSHNGNYYYGYYTFDQNAQIDSLFDPNWGAIRTDYMYDPSYKRWVIFHFDHFAEGALSHHSDLYKKLLPVFDAHFSVPADPTNSSTSFITQRMYVYVGK